MHKVREYSSEMAMPECRRLRQIRNYVSREIMIQLVLSLVICHMDYCNSVLVGLPASHLPLSNGFRMQLLGSFLASVVGLTLLLLLNNSTGSQ